MARGSSRFCRRPQSPFTSPAPIASTRSPGRLRCATASASSASGATPYALGAAAAARAAGALTIGIVNNPGAPLATACEIAVLLDTGPEVIGGSTRLKAGTAQKIALNSFSSAVMVRLNKVYGNLMVDLRASNAKLVRRALRLTQRASGADESTAALALAACDMRVKLAIVMLRCGVDAAEAERRLAAVDGSVHLALQNAPLQEM